jgi:hypothetical protein
MANKFTRYLSGFGNGLVAGVTNPKGNMGNWRHATRLFVDNTYALAPRNKFNYFVRIELDSSALRAPQFKAKHADEIGLLVKTADLPKFTIDQVTKNQYNRKRIVYKNLNYDPVTFTFHDDNTGVINAFWAIYYGYYSVDRSLPQSAWGDTKYRPMSGGQSNFINNFRYGMDNNIQAPLIKSISVYTMSRRRFNGYTLVNPKITSWQHGQGDYASGDGMEHTMTVAYEAVQYSSGTVSAGSPKGFATLHYDNLPSPLSVAGGGTSTLTGEGGVLAGLESIFGAIGSGDIFNSPGNFLGAAIASINTYKNIRNLSKEGLKREAINILTGPAAAGAIANTIGGVVGTVWPKNSSTSAQGDSTSATQRQIVPSTNTGTTFT